jgi:hypothetical protein
MPGEAERGREVTSDPAYVGAVTRAVRGDLNALVLLDEDLLGPATRSLSVMLGGAIGLAALVGPKSVAGFTFWMCHGHLTFAPTDPDVATSQSSLLAAQLVAMDANALVVHCDFGQAAHDSWDAMYGSVPVTGRRRFALSLAARFAATPVPAAPPARAPDPSWRSR